MFSVLNYYVQAIVTGQGPVQNWASHIADPVNVNGFALSYMAKFAPEPVAMFSATSARMAPTECTGWVPTLRVPPLST